MSHRSSDGGALLLKAADRHYGLVAGLSSCLRDDRQAGKVDHSLRELVAQRVFSIACGYPDANDSARLSEDPIHKLLLDRDPIEGRALASQPTLHPESRKSFKLQHQPTLKNLRYSNWLKKVLAGTATGRWMRKQSAC